MVKTKGEILEFDEGLENLQAIDIQGEIQVNDVSVLPGNIIWAITSDGLLYKFANNTNQSINKRTLSSRILSGWGLKK